VCRLGRIDREAEHRALDVPLFSLARLRVGFVLFGRAFDVFLQFFVLVGASVGLDVVMGGLHAHDW
jgi:hypothetical protein